MDERLRRLVHYHGGRVPEDDMGESWVWPSLIIVVVVFLGIVLVRW